MGGANVGPEFTSEEYMALEDLCAKEAALAVTRSITLSGFMQVLEQAVINSGRWRKWLLSGEEGLDFRSLQPERRAWLAQTGARYIWTSPAVVEARARLYGNLRVVIADPHRYVVERIQRSIDRYINAFHLFDSVTIL